MEDWDDLCKVGALSGRLVQDVSRGATEVQAHQNKMRVTSLTTHLDVCVRVCARCVSAVCRSVTFACHVLEAGLLFLFFVDSFTFSHVCKETLRAAMFCRVFCIAESDLDR